jgi:hypothetical protein
LDRLFAAARAAAPEAPEAMPAYLQRRILEQWRAGVPWADAGRSLAQMFRGALIGATMVALLSIAWSVRDLADEPENDEAMANYELRADLMP